MGRRPDRPIPQNWLDVPDVTMSLRRADVTLSQPTTQLTGMCYRCGSSQAHTHRAKDHFTFCVTSIFCFSQGTFFRRSSTNIIEIFHTMRPWLQTPVQPLLC